MSGVSLPLLASQPVPSASAARANPSTGRLASHEVSYPEESLALKVLAAVPLIGSFVSLGCQLSLNSRIESIISTLPVKPKYSEALQRARDAISNMKLGDFQSGLLDMSEKKSPVDKAKYEKMADLLEAQNHYKYASATSFLLTTAAVVTVIALSVFSGGAVPLAAGIGLGLLGLGVVLGNAGIIVLTAVKVNENKDIIELLRRDFGAPLGLSLPTSAKQKF